MNFDPACGLMVRYTAAQVLRACDYAGFAHAIELETMSVSSSTSQVEVQLFRHQIERDYSIQCEDVSELLSVAQFKQRCRDLSEELTTHVIRDESEADLEIAGACKSVK